MQQIETIEKLVAGWYAQVPHLPAGGRKWLADNAWWIVIVGLVLSVFGLLGLLSVLFLAGTALTVLGGAAGGIGGAAVGAAVGGAVLIAGLVSVAVYLVEVVLMGMAISPLKEHKKRGWNLIFYVTLLNVVSVVVSGVLNFNIPSLVFGLIWIAIGAYFLFEVRGLFGGTPVVAKPAEKAPAPVEKKPSDAGQDKEEV